MRPRRGNYKFREPVINHLSKVLRWLARETPGGFISGGPSWSDTSKLDPLLVHLDTYLRCRGKIDFLSYVRNLRLSYLSFLSGETRSYPNIRLTKSGLPYRLRSLDKQSGSKDFIPYILTCLTIDRPIKLKSSVSLDSITLPATGGTIVDKSHPKYFWKSIGSGPSQKVPRALRFRNYHLSTKNGPNGHALFYSLVDLNSLPDSLINSIEVISGGRLANSMRGLRDPEVQQWLSFLPSLPRQGRKPQFRKIVSFPDLAGKSRTIAILDYWSQTCLKPLHTWLMRHLKLIHQDCTFDQGSFVDKIKDWDYFHSLDLSSATDRFPISFISYVLKGRLPQHYVDSWEDIMVGYPFWVPELNKYISYSVGNPMGAYSSWASFAIAHHYVVYSCCAQLKIDWKSAKYVILGDDILIGDTELAEAYTEMIGILGVEISAVKTHRSPNLAEFAKRWFFKGQEVTPFSTNITWTSKKRWDLLLPGLVNERMKGWPFQDLPCVLEGFYKDVYPMSRKWIRSNKPLWELSELITKVVRGEGTAFDVISKGGSNLPELSGLGQQEFEILLQQEIKQLFLESWSQSHVNGERLDELSLRLTLLITDPEVWSLFGSLGVDLHDVPVLNVIGQVEQMFMDIQQGYRTLQELGDTWDFSLRCLGIPLTTDLLLYNRQEIRSVVAATLSKRVLKALRARTFES